MQTLSGIASEKSSTTVRPLPTDLITPFMEALKKR
jgi:hypothetical protein